MQLLHRCSILLAAFLFNSLAAAQLRSESVLVRYAVDGDTIDVAAVGRVRLLGIDAPELGRGLETSEPFAIEAHQRLTALVARRWVRLESEGQSIRRDDYNRQLAYVLLETGVLVNAVLVREGLARVSARDSLRRLPALKSAEAEAQRSRRGMWGERPQIPLERYVVPRRPAVPSRSRRRLDYGNGARASLNPLP